MNNITTAAILSLAMTSTSEVLAQDCLTNLEVTFGSSQRPPDGFEPVDTSVLQLIPALHCSINKEIDFGGYGFINYDIEGERINELDTGLYITKKVTNDLSITGTLDYWAPQQSENFYVPGIGFNYKNFSYQYQNLINNGERHLFSLSKTFETFFLGEEFTITPKIGATLIDRNYFGVENGLSTLRPGISFSTKNLRISLEYHSTKREQLPKGLYGGISWKF